MKLEELDSGNLPKYVVAGINTERRVIDFMKTVVIEDEGEVRPGSWQLPLYETREEAQKDLEEARSVGAVNDRMVVCHIDELHVAFAKFLTENPV